ncbi:MAG: hypothetical protein RIB84_05810 [Sneathiellaceae bacterium]
MFPFVLGLIYLLLCFAVAWLGRHTPIGALGVLVLAILLTPVIVFLAMMALSRPRVAR